MDTAKDVFDRARFHLNDVGAAYFTDAVLLPALQIAYDDLKGELFDNNVPITNNQSSSLVIAVGMTDVGGSTGPHLPPRLIEIQKIAERTQDSSEEWIDMARVDFLPNYVSLYQSLIYWTWEGQIIKFNGATTNREIKLDYIEDLIGVIQNAASTISIIRAIPFLSYRTAALAAGFSGEDDEREGKLNNNAGRELDKLINISVKGSQVMPVRRRPFMAGYRRGGGIISS